MKEEKKYYIPVGREKVYVKEELFNEFNRLRSSQAYYNNRYRDNTCELNEAVDVYRYTETVEEQLLKKCLKKQLYSAIESLDEDEKRVIYLIFFEEMSERKAAEAMGLKQYKVHRIKEKALKKIKEKIIF